MCATDSPDGPVHAPGDGALLRTLLLTDLVDSTRLVEKLGDRRAFEVFGRHDQLARSLLAAANGREIDKTDGFLILFERPVDAVRYALAYHRGLARLGRELGLELAARAGIHMGEVYTRSNPPEEVARGAKPLEVEGLAKPAAARVMSLAGGRQTLLSRGAFDLARRAALDTDLASLRLRWLEHGRYAFKGIEEPVQVFEVGEDGFAPLAPPPDSAKARRVAERAAAASPIPSPGPSPAPARVAAGSRLGRYTVTAPLGSGGMGEVFRATDTELERQVAVKVLRSDHATDPERLQRFRREARAVARLSHPNILEIFDIGHEGATPFVVTELLEGRNLRETMGGRPLPWRTAVEIALQVARALAAAHRGGVVHRDLKPENVLCTDDGRVKVLDFGLARLLGSPHSSSATETLAAPTTRTGAIIGTAGYLSPEQLRGEPADGRADLFAFGCMLYEMLGGRRPFVGGSAAEVMAATLREEPEDVEQLCPEAPEALLRLVARCLAKDREQRPADAEETAAVLESLAGSAASRRPGRVSRRRRAVGAAVVATTAALLAVASWRLWRTPPAPSAAAPERSDRVVVAVFDNRTGNPELDTIGVMCADVIAQGLSQAGITKVVPSVFGVQAFNQVRAAAVDDPTLNPLVALAAATDARLVVSGSIYQVGDTLQIRAQVTNAEDSRVELAVEPASGSSADPVAVVAAVRERVAGALAAHYGMGIDLSMMSDPPSAEAFAAFSQGLVHFGGDYDTSVRELRRAVELAPGFVEARIWLAGAYGNTGHDRLAAEVLDSIPTGDHPLTAYEHHLVAWHRAASAGRLLEALEAAREMHALAPRAGMPTYVHAYSALHANRPGETLAVAAGFRVSASTKMLASSYWLHWPVMQAYHLLGRYEEELAHSRQASADFPDVLSLRSGEVRALAALGRLDELEDAVQRSLTVTRSGDLVIHAGTPGSLMTRAATALRVHGEPAAAEAMAERAVDWYSSHPAPALDPVELVFVEVERLEAYVLAGRLDEAAAIAAALGHGLEQDQLFYRAVVHGSRGAVAAYAGDLALARAEDRELERMAGPFLFGENLYQRARIAAVLGEGDRAFNLLREAFAAGKPHAIEVHTELAFDTLRELPAFRRLVDPEG